LNLIEPFHQKIIPFPDYPNRSGWPWVSENTIQKNRLPADFLRPKISIVTPSYNQAQYLEEAIRSVLLQGYPNMEYIVMDGGSTDGSVEIIKKYEPWLTYWVSEKDDGQASAINKGFSLATGELAGWLNSDDIFFPQAFERVASWWVKNGKPDDLITGTKVKGNPSLDSFSRLQQEPFTREHLLDRCIIEQPSTFFTLKSFRDVGGLDNRYYLSIDYDLWLRMTKKGSKIQSINADLAVTRTHSLTKTGLNQKSSCQESLLAVWRNYRLIPETWLKKWITFQVVPSKIKNEFATKFFYLFRDGFYCLARWILNSLGLLHHRQEESKIELPGQN